MLSRKEYHGNLNMRTNNLKEPLPRTTKAAFHSNHVLQEVRINDFNVNKKNSPCTIINTNDQ